ncbi:MAG: septum formation initiator family protein [Ghiorsea sp.]
MAYSIGLVIIVLMIWDVLLSDHGYFVFKGEHKQQQVLESEIESFTKAKQKLKADIIELRENPKTLEQVIHKELGYVYPDEYMLIMPENKQALSTSDMIEKKRNKDE